MNRLVKAIGAWMVVECVGGLVRKGIEAYKERKADEEVLLTAVDIYKTLYEAKSLQIEELERELEELKNKGMKL